MNVCTYVSIVYYMCMWGLCMRNLGSVFVHQVKLVHLLCVYVICLIYQNDRHSILSCLLSSFHPCIGRYLMSQQRQWQDSVGKVSNSSRDGSNTPHTSSTTTTTTATATVVADHSWWGRLLSFPATAIAPKAPPATALPVHVQTKAEADLKKIETRYATLLAKYGKVPATAPLSLPSLGDEVSRECYMSVCMYVCIIYMRYNSLAIYVAKYLINISVGIIYVMYV